MTTEGLKTYAAALGEGLAEEMRNDSNVIAYGESFELGFVWGVSRGLVDEFGPTRIRDVPLSENLHIGMAIGAALTGLVPVVELQYSDFMMLGMDGIVNQAAKLTYMTGGQVERMGVVIRLPYGHLKNYGAQHSQTLYGLFSNVPGLTVCAPSTPADAKGLLKTAIRAGRPVLFFEHKRLYTTKGNVPEGDHAVPFGVARTYGEGTDATVVAIGWMLHQALEAQERLSAEGIDVTVIDPRTIVPLDIESIVRSVRTTGRLILADEAPLRGGFTAFVASEVHRLAFDYLHAPPARVGVHDVPIPYSWPLEDAVIPQAGDIVEAVKANLNY